MLPPTTVKEVRSFLGLTGYYRQLIPNYADLTFPISELTKKHQPFVWSPECNEAFEKLKELLSQEPVLAHPNPSKPYVLHTDASNLAIGAVLSQVDDFHKEKVICYLSHKLSDSQQKWSTIEKEAYAIIYALKKFHAYLHGAEFKIKTDHKPLRSLFQSEIKNTKLQRWAIQISEYGAPIEYHPGKLNVAADMLSRIASATDIPCPQIQKVEPPGVWDADGIDWSSLIKYQRDQFPNEFLEAEDASDESRYVTENYVLFTMAPPYPNADIYPRVLLPQQHRQKVIDRCHSETGHAGALKTLLRVQENYVWPGMRQHIRDYITTCTHCRTLTPPNTASPRGTLLCPLVFSTHGHLT